ncbi:unnamed protein product [marine sediment metagenome]|uniref:Uncharacterized protein n=1 Tax=marine sediment metagenome TaxID=412755 RepID=X1MN16_9ZZZZ
MRKQSVVSKCVTDHMNEYKIFCFSLPKMYNRYSYIVYLLKPAGFIYGDDENGRGIERVY